MADVPIGTTKVIITNHWLEVSEGACILQSVNDRDTYGKTFFDLVIGGLEPTADTDTFMRIMLSGHANFNQNASVWLRLNVADANKDQPIVVIK